MTTTSKISLAVLAIAAGSAFASPSFANTKDLRSICDSARLSHSDRVACGHEFDAAKTDADRTAVFKAYDNKMNGLAPDGSKLAKGASSEQSAESK